MGRNSERDEREAIRRKNQLIHAGFELFSPCFVKLLAV